MERSPEHPQQKTPSPTSVAQPVGPALPGWTSRSLPQRISHRGRYSRIEPLDPALHAAPLWQALCAPQDAALWTYLPHEPPATFAAWEERLQNHASSRDPLFFTLFNERGEPAGLAAYLRIAPEHGSIEIGHIQLSRILQQSRAATEIQYLLLRYAFEELGYRRYEWKCDALNEPSRRAALRLGFRHEGIFRNAAVYKQRSRDTAWFSVIDDEWPGVRRAIESWLDPSNFDSSGRQRASLAQVRTEPART